PPHPPTHPFPTRRSSDLSHPARVQQEHLDGMGRQQLEDAVALEPVRQGEERVGPRHPQELALLGLASGRGAGGLAEHEVRGGLLDRKSTRLNSSHVSISY